MGGKSQGVMKKENKMEKRSWGEKRGPKDCVEGPEGNERANKKTKGQRPAVRTTGNSLRLPMASTENPLEWGGGKTGGSFEKKASEGCGIIKKRRRGYRKVGETSTGQATITCPGVPDHEDGAARVGGGRS